MLEEYDNFLNIDSTVADISKGITESNVESAISSGAISYDQTTLNTLTGNESFKSSTYVQGISGWKIDGYGNVEFNNGVFRGQLIAGQIHIPSLTDMESFHVDSSGNAWWGHNSYANAPAYILSDGTAKFTIGLIGGTIIGSDYIKSNNYDSGIAGKGWKLDSDGNADFQNIKVRGKISSSVFEKDTISAIGGSLLLTPSDTLAADMDSDDLILTTTNTVFAVGTILRIKDETYDEWLKVTEVDSNNHTVTRDISNNYPGVKPSWKTGVAVVSMGNTGDGFIEMDTSGINTPFIKLSKRESDTYNDVDTKVIIGNLKDKTGVEEYGLWVKGESVYIGGYKTYDAIASKNGSDTEVYYAGQVFTSIKACIDYAETQSEDKIIIFVKNGTYSELQNCSSTNTLNQGGWDIDVILIGEDKDNTSIDFNGSNWGWKFDRRLTITNITIRAGGEYQYGPIVFKPSIEEYNYLSIYNSYISKTSINNNPGQVCLYIFSEGYYGIIRIKESTIYYFNNTGSASQYSIKAERIDNSYFYLENNDIYSSRSGIELTTGTISNSVISIENNKIDCRWGSGIIFDGYSNKININNNSILNGEGIPRSFAVGISLSSLTTSKETTISNNYIYSFGIGIYDSTYGGSYCNNNIIKYCTTYGIQSQGSLSGVSANRNIFGNLFISCGISNTVTGAIYFEYFNIIIKNNVFYSCFCGIIDGNVPSKNIIISENYIKNSAFGIRILGYDQNSSLENLVITNNFISGDYSYGAGDGITIPSGRSIVISENVVDGFKNYSLRLQTRKSGQNEISDLTINSNRFGYADNLIMSVSSFYIDIYNSIITNNFFKKTLSLDTLGQSVITNNFIDDNIEIEGAFSNNNVSCNTIINGIHVNNIYGIYGSIISNNIIKSDQIGISSSGPIKYSTISGNNIESNGPGIGIYSGDSYEFYINNNKINSGGSNSIILFTGNIIGVSSSISSNTLIKEGGQYNGIHITGNANNVIISNNGIWCGNGSDTRYGIRVNNTATYCIFSCNRIAQGVPTGTQDGIYLGSNSGSIFNSNLRT